MNKTKAFAYLRVSSQGQGQKDRDGFPRQRQAIDAFAKTNRIDLAGEYKDEIAGKAQADDRPKFKQMVTDMLTNSVRAVIVERLDRLAREYRIQEELALYLAGHGIDLYSADTGENISDSLRADPMKKALVQMRGVFAELDKSMLVLKLRKARDAKSEKAGRRIEGRKRYGTRPGEKDVLALMRRLYKKPYRRDRRTFSQIARILNEKGILSRQGLEWSDPAVRQILQRS